jgi:hypothetical protein
VRWLQQAAKVHREMVQRDPERIAGYVSRLKTFAADLASAGLTLAALSRPGAPAPAVRFALRHGFALLVGAPLALCGFLIHGLPFATINLALGWVPHTGEEVATNKIAGGLIFYPLFWLLEGWLLWHYWGGAALLAFIVLLVPAGFVALSWRERLARVEAGIRGYLRLRREPGMLERLRAERDALLKELQDLAGETAGGPVR